MSPPFKTSRRVEFRDTDAAGIAHFSCFFVFMEQAEHEFLRAQGLSVHMEHDQDVLSWPRVHAHCDYVGPVKFEDLLEIEVSIERMGERSVTYGFRFSKGPREVARGRLVAVCCRMNPHGPPQSMPIPVAIADKLRPWIVSSRSQVEPGLE